jgi:glycerophosphoryl diester phosphodiesterase
VEGLHHPDHGGGPVDELLAFYRQGVDGVFADFPDTAFGAREIFRGL